MENHLIPLNKRFNITIKFYSKLIKHAVVKLTNYIDGHIFVN